MESKSQPHKRPMVGKDQASSFQGNGTLRIHTQFFSHLCSGLSHLPIIARQLPREVLLPLQPMPAWDPEESCSCLLTLGMAESKKWPQSNRVYI